MVVIILAQTETASGVEVQQSLYRLDILNRVMIELVLQLKKKKSCSQTPGKQQHAGQHQEIPKSQARANVPGTQSFPRAWSRQFPVAADR